MTDLPEPDWWDCARLYGWTVVKALKTAPESTVVVAGQVLRLRSYCNRTYCVGQYPEGER